MRVCAGFVMAGEQGVAEAQSALGASYYYGKGVAKDYREAVRWYRMAAEQGNAKRRISWVVHTIMAKVLPRIIARRCAGIVWRQSRGGAFAQNNLGNAYYQMAKALSKMIARRCAGIVRRQIKGMRLRNSIWAGHTILAKVLSRIIARPFAGIVWLQSKGLCKGAIQFRVFIRKWRRRCQGSS